MKVPGTREFTRQQRTLGRWGEESNMLPVSSSSIASTRMLFVYICRTMFTRLRIYWHMVYLHMCVDEIHLSRVRPYEINIP